MRFRREDEFWPPTPQRPKRKFVRALRRLSEEGLKLDQYDLPARGQQILEGPTSVC
jgi:hypothetical protein